MKRTRRHLGRLSGRDRGRDRSPAPIKLRSGSRLPLALALAVSAATVAIGGAQAAIAAAPGANGAIVFVSDRDSVDANGDGKFQNSERNREVYSVNPDGTGLARLTDDLDSDTRPTAAPNGRTIAFDSSRSGNDELYVMKPDGSGVSQVTDRGAPDRGPSFSADGQRLAYSVRHASTLPGGNSEGDIWTVNTDGTETTRLTFDRELDEFDPAFSPDGSRIAFVGGTPGNVGSSYDVFLVDADGSNMVNLTGPSGGAGAEDADPSFSPDGTRITFMSDRDGGPEIWAMDIDGSNAQQLTDASGRDEQPTFSPDGTKIAFTARRGGSTDLYTMNADGSQQTRLTDDAPLSERDELAEWTAVTPAGQVDTFIDSGPRFVGSDPDVNFTYSGSSAGPLDGFGCRIDGGGFSACAASGAAFSGLADGRHTFEVRAESAGAPDATPASYTFEVDTTRIVFASDRDGNSEIYMMDADGTGQSRLTNNAGADSGPALSPDGSAVAFASDRDGDEEIYVISADGTGSAEKLTDNSSADRSPVFSPDGSRIIFTSGRDGNDEIYAMESDGSGAVNLTANPADDRDPSLPADGSAIAFQSDRGAAGNPDIYSMNADGSGVVRLTDDPAADGDPDFSPDGTEIAFTRGVDPGDGSPVNDEVWRMAADGSGQINITNHPRGIDDRQPSYRPDGKKIAYQDEGDIYVQGLDGTARTRLTAAAATDSVPDWGAPVVAASGPQTTITAGPLEASTISDPSPSFSFTSDDPAADFECRFDSDPFAACSNPASHSPQSPLADGPHAFEVRAVDGAGNVDGSPARRSFTIDTGAPQTTITAGPLEASTISDPSPSFSFTSDDPAADFECRFDSDPFAACSNPASHSPQSPLADGPHAFEVRAVDGAGNVDGSPARRSFTIDTGAPQTTITAGPLEASTISDPSPSFSFTSDDPAADFECRFDSDPFAACSNPASHSPQSPLADGPHAFEVRAVDGAGNVDGSPARRSFTIDTGAPQTTLCQGERATIVSVPGAVTIGTSGSDVIVGTPGADDIRAKGGADLICTLGGDDYVSAAGGDDRVYGEAGADFVTGGGGTDQLFGGVGPDHLDGGSGHDALDGGADWDECIGGTGTNTLTACEST